MVRAVFFIKDCAQAHKEARESSLDLYGAETQVLTKLESTLNVWERKTLWKIYGQLWRREDSFPSFIIL